MLRMSALAIGAAVVFGAQAANAVTVFDNINGVPFNGQENFMIVGGVNHANGSPLGNSFSLSATANVDFVTLDLRDPTNLSGGFSQDGGSIQVYLVPDVPIGGTPTPSSTGVTLTAASRIFLGAIADASLGANFVTKTIATNVDLNSGRYWIELVNSSDTVANGGLGGNMSNALWAFNDPGAGGVGTVGEVNSFSNGTGFVVHGDAGVTGRMIVDANFILPPPTVPEPASLMLLGFGVAATGLVRRRAR